MKNLTALTIFSIAMGMLEAAVVVYLRAIYYPDGFNFPLMLIDDKIIAITELLREAATLVMLVGIGYLFGKTLITRFAGFLISFAVWDIFYYVFLKMLLDWPASLFTWDVLFLLPVTWVGPVLAPVIISFTMILYGLVFIHLEEKGRKPRLKFADWAMMIGFSLVLIFSFTKDVFALIQNNNNQESSANSLLAVLQNFNPINHNWYIFAIGEIGLLFFIAKYWKTYSSTNQ